MPENQEQIESRLSGYVDDTLDPAERAEIEAHLDAHPQHRQLLGELRKMREALRALPREKAPAELSESFTGQLERSVLLDGIADRPIEPRMRIVHWPRLATVAAILLLAGGLGTVVYFELSATKSHPQFSQNAQAPAPANGSNATLESVHGNKIVEPPPAPAPGSPDASHVAPVAPAPQTAPMAPGALDRQAVAAEMPAIEKAPADAQADAQAAAIAHSALVSRQVQAMLGQTEQADRLESPGRPVVVMVVSTPDLKAATRKLGTYLETSNADWQSAPLIDGLMQEQQKAFANGTLEEAQARDFGGVGKSKDLTGATAPSPAASGGDRGKASPATQPQTQPGAFAYAGRPSADAEPMNNASPPQQSQNQAINNSTPGNPIANALADEPVQASPAKNRFYVVRNLSFQQASQLSDILRQTGPNTQAPMFTDQAMDGANKAELNRGPNRQQSALALADDISNSTTQPTTQPFQPSPLASNILADHPDIRAPQTRPTPAPAGAGPAAIAGIVPINKQTLLGSSPVDLVIVMKTAAPVAPTTVPATQPATRPEE